MKKGEGRGERRGTFVFAKVSVEFHISSSSFFLPSLPAYLPASCLWLEFCFLHTLVAILANDYGIPNLKEGFY